MFWVVGKGWIRLPMVADSMSRSGSVEELAAGPVHYGICITLGTLFFWKRVEALYCILPISFGDGFAAFFGPRVRGNRPLGWNPSKTWFGLIAFVAWSFLGLVAYITLFEKLICNPMLMNRERWLLNSDSNYLWNSLLVSIMCGITETLTIANYDNYTIFCMGILSYYYVHCPVCEQTLDCLLFSTA